MASDLSIAVTKLIEEKVRPTSTSSQRDLPEARLPKAGPLSVFVVYPALLRGDDLELFDDNK